MALSFLKLLAALEESLQTPFLPLPPPQPVAGSAKGRVHAGGRAAPGGTCAPQNRCVPSPGERRGLRAGQPGGCSTGAGKRPLWGLLS